MRFYVYIVASLMLAGTFIAGGGDMSTFRRKLLQQAQIKPVNYLQSSGAALLHTDYIPKAASRYYIDFQLMSARSARVELMNGGHNYYSQARLATAGGSFSFTKNYKRKLAGWNNDNVRHVLSMSDPTTICLDDGDTQTLINPTNETTSPVYFFSSGSWRLYRWKVIENDEIIADLRPAIDASNVPCFYDVVSNKCFYANNQDLLIYG